jgi:phosphoglycolate phosphatase-like HAD superfamily hydrolase
LCLLKIRIATFDLDGTLWIEQPMYVQAQFVIDLFIKRHGTIPGYGHLATLLERVRNGMSELHQALATLASLIRASIGVDEYTETVEGWLSDAKHPCFERLYTDLVYLPMQDLLSYLRSNRFRTYIVSGSGIEFARSFSLKAFGIPPEQVIGSSLKTDFVANPDGTGGAIRLLPWPDFTDNGKRKAESINEFIARRPLIAFGNSDGDQQMLQWTAGGKGPRLAALVHHTDAAREYEYGTAAHVGHLSDVALAEAEARGWYNVNGRGWIVIDMARDWETVFAFGLAVRNGSPACRAR